MQGITQIGDNETSIQLITDNGTQQVLKGSRFPEDTNPEDLDIEKLTEDCRAVAADLLSGLTHVAFQGIRNNKTGEFDKYEMLSRSIGKNGQVISPARYMGFLEANDLDNTLVLMNLQNIRAFLILQNFNTVVNINFGRNQLKNINFITFFIKELKRFGIPLENVHIEVTEYCKFDIRVIHSIYLLKQAGIKVGLDDFGTGLSNLELFLKFHPDFIKIPGELVSSMDGNVGSLILSTIVNFANSLNIPVVAEKVENQFQEDRLKELGVQYSQGYLYSRPTVFSSNRLDHLLIKKQNNL